MNLFFRSIKRYLLVIGLLGGGAVSPLYGESTPIMPFAEVRIGMKGYGLSVFHGTAIEPFPVEIITVVSDSSPGRGLIWMRCTSERMQISGPVQGMSGSPVYLWDEGEEGELGQGGRLIGAFAYGYGLSKDCIVGVQPIELMRDVASRKDEVSAMAAGSWYRARQTFANLNRIAQQNDTKSIHRFRFDLLRKLVGAKHASRSVTSQEVSGFSSQSARPMLLPVSMGRGSLARVLGPLYKPMGLMPVSGQTLGGPPPVGTDIEGTKLEPGSVLSVPLVFGDMDLAAAGTVTDVLNDGTVLGFGHAMFSHGPTVLPMATGYIHYVMPSIVMSFKQSGSLRMIGSLVRDEESAVVGIREQRYTTAPVQIEVTLANKEVESYDYEVVNFRPLTAMLAATVMARSLLARHDLPIENTVDLTASMTFEGGRVIEVESSLPGADVFTTIIELLPALVMMTDNPFEPLELESMQVKMVVREGIDIATIVAARLDHAEVAPGATVRVAVEVEPYRGERRTLHTTLTLPTDLAEGDYQLVVSGASQYAGMYFGSRPHRMDLRNVDELAQMIRDMLAIRGQAVYLSLQGQDSTDNLAVGRTEMPHLPSSRAAILASPTHTLTTPFAELVFSQLDTQTTIDGQIFFQLSVREAAYGATHD